MRISKIAALLLLFTLNVEAQDIEDYDPYDVQLPAKADYKLSLRVLNHGVPDAKAWIEEQVRAAEVIYSQCGSRIKVEVTQFQDLPYSTEHDHLTEFSNDLIIFTEQAKNFFTKVLPGKNHDVLDIHVVDHLNPAIRESGSIINESVYLGQSYHPRLIGWVFHGASPSLAGQHVLLAAETVRISSNSFIWIGDKRGYNRHLSLLAHEIGHQILEDQTPEQGYRDHWCEAQDGYCDFGNLMSGGGNPDMIWKHIIDGSVGGFDKLPTMDAVQCQQLLRHPLLKKAD